MANDEADELRLNFDRNVFVMMRYRETTHFRDIENALRAALRPYGLIARFAKDRAYTDQLWENVKLYMASSRYGIAVFEEIDEREFNPNVTLELGYMFGQGRRCLLLKDRRMPRLPTDVVGHIYRDFDTYNLNATITEQVTAWCSFDLNLDSTLAPTADAGSSFETLYDSNTDPNFGSWLSLEMTATAGTLKLCHGNRLLLAYHRRSGSKRKTRRSSARTRSSGRRTAPSPSSIGRLQQRALRRTCIFVRFLCAAKYRARRTWWNSAQNCQVIRRMRFRHIERDTSFRRRMLVTVRGTRRRSSSISAYMRTWDTSLSVSGSTKVRRHPASDASMSAPFGSNADSVRLTAAADKLLMDTERGKYAAPHGKRAETESLICPPNA